MTRFRRTIAVLAAISLGSATFMQGAQATVIGTAQVAAAAQGAVDHGNGRAHLRSALERADVAAALQAHGVDLAAARARAAALTDAEADALAAQIDSAPAGGDVLGTIVFLFVLLLITDILGFTKVFPFTRSIR